MCLFYGAALACSHARVAHVHACSPSCAHSAAQAVAAAAAPAYVLEDHTARQSYERNNSSLLLAPRRRIYRSIMPMQCPQTGGTLWPFDGDGEHNAVRALLLFVGCCCSSLAVGCLFVRLLLMVWHECSVYMCCGYNGTRLSDVYELHVPDLRWTFMNGTPSKERIPRTKRQRENAFFRLFRLRVVRARSE